LSSILVLGVGSPFGADTLGWQVVERLEAEVRRRDRLRGTVELKREDRPGLRLLDLMRPYDHVILIDGVVSDAAPGTLFHLQRDALLHFRAPPSTHAAGIPEALALGAILDELPARIELFGLSVEPEGPVSPAAVLKLARAVITHLEAQSV
jgi:hydrogenase maturation protease